MFATNSMVESDAKMNEGVPDCARCLASAEVDVAVYACTGGSFFKGPGYDQDSAGGVVSGPQRNGVVVRVHRVNAARQRTASFAHDNQHNGNYQNDATRYHAGDRQQQAAGGQ